MLYIERMMSLLESGVLTHRASQQGVKENVRKALSLRFIQCFSWMSRSRGPQNTALSPRSIVERVGFLCLGHFAPAQRWSLAASFFLASSMALEFPQAERTASKAWTTRQSPSATRRTGRGGRKRVRLPDGPCPWRGPGASPPSPLRLSRRGEERVETKCKFNRLSCFLPLPTGDEQGVGGRGVRTAPWARPPGGGRVGAYGAEVQAASSSSR